MAETYFINSELRVVSFPFQWRFIYYIHINRVVLPHKYPVELFFNAKNDLESKYNNESTTSYHEHLGVALPGEDTVKLTSVGWRVFHPFYE